MNSGLFSSGRVILASAVLFTVLAVAVPGAVPAANAAKGQPSCAKFQKKIRKSKTAAKKRTARRELKQCRANAMVRNRIGNSHFTGYREDGVEFDTIYCRNGAVQNQPGLGGKVEKGGWRVEFARVRSPKNFTAIMYTPIRGGAFVQSVGFKNGQWQVGYEFGDQPQSLGDATRTDASKECKSFQG
ncbi:MAG: hypothetical protein KDB52_10815 [Solirubrobacterales bacterium]|nr:hypothetical protein [Solirubrobacterales bacterium]